MSAPPPRSPVLAGLPVPIVLAPVFGILSPGSLVRIQPEAGGDDGSGVAYTETATVRPGMLSGSIRRWSMVPARPAAASVASEVL